MATNHTPPQQVKIRLKGHKASATFTKLADAKRWESTTEAAIREKRYFKTSESERHTLAELIDRYIRDVIPCKGRMGTRSDRPARMVAL